MAFPFHTIESTKPTRQASAVQTMNMQVPTFRAFKCQYRGTTERTSPIPANTENTVVEAVISTLETVRDRYEVFELVWCTRQRLARQVE